LKEWPVASTRTWQARATTVCSSATVAGRWNSGAAKAMLPAQLVRGLGDALSWDPGPGSPLTPYERYAKSLQVQAFAACASSRCTSHGLQPRRVLRITRTFA